jgi:hypothetical protein
MVEGAETQVTMRLEWAHAQLSQGEGLAVKDSDTRVLTQDYHPFE